MWKLPLFTLALSLNTTVQASELPIHIINSYYEEPTKLSGTITYINQTAEVEISQIIPAKLPEAESVSIQFKVPQGPINEIDLVLTSTRQYTMDPDLAATLIASKKFSVPVSPVAKLAIFIDCQELTAALGL